MHHDPGYSGLGVGIKHYVTPDHGSEERRLMLISRYRESKRKEREAKEAGDGAESCKQKGRAESFRHILAMEYGEDIYERGNENGLL